MSSTRAAGIYPSRAETTAALVLVAWTAQFAEGGHRLGPWRADSTAAAARQAHSVRDRSAHCRRCARTVRVWFDESGDPVDYEGMKLGEPCESRESFSGDHSATESFFAAVVGLQATMTDAVHTAAGELHRWVQAAALQGHVLGSWTDLSITSDDDPWPAGALPFMTTCLRCNTGGVLVIDQVNGRLVDEVGRGADLILSECAP